MVSVGKILVLWLWRSFILRRRNWLITSLEIIVPIWCMYFVQYLNSLVGMFAIIPEFKTHPFLDEYPLDTKSFAAFLSYTPSNDLTDRLMTEVRDCLLSPFLRQFTDILTSHSSTDGIENWMNSRTLNGWMSFAIIFHEADLSTNSFVYTIRTNLPLSTEYTKDHYYASLDKYRNSYFLQVQSCVDTNILKTLNITLPPIMVGNLPDISSDVKLIMTILDFMLILSTVLLVASVLTDVIQEKASGIKEMMKMMGIPSWMIWIQFFIHNIILYLPITLCVAVLLTVIEPVVVKASLLLVWLLLVMFVVNVIVLIFFASCFFNNYKLANALLIVSWALVNLTFSIRLNPFDVQKIYVQWLICLLMPFLNISWALKTIASFEKFSGEFRWSSVLTVGYSGSKISVGLSIVLFVCDTVLMLVFTLYLDAVRPGPYGIAKHPTFIFNWVRRCLQKPPEVDYDFSPRKSLPGNFESAPKSAEVGIEVRGLRKVFNRPHRAVALNNVDLDIYKGEIMVLLGHNGAGKTTLMSMITGLMSATSGTIKVNGRLMQKNLKTFRQNLGLCTQHDLYFPKLTVINHLVFFGVLKGMSFDEARKEGMKLLQTLNIQEKANSLGKTLSGGMKRRLCLANSLVGNPEILILDEPTSGLDPETRRLIWNIILGFRGSRTILITTHFMEEADVLGDRIAIMDRGLVICCGTTLFLKKVYGGGYSVHILKSPDAEESNISTLIRGLVPNFEKRVVSQTQVDYNINSVYVDKFPELFTDLEKSKNSLGITGISVNSATLEQVFLKVAEESEINQFGQKEEKTVHLKYSFDRSEEYESVKECSLFCQRVEALVIKRFIYMKRRWISHVLRLVFSCVLVFYMTYRSSYHAPSEELQDPLVLSLGELYPGTVNPIMVKEPSPFKDAVVETLQQEGGGFILIPPEGNMDGFVKNLAEKDFVAFWNEALLGITITPSDIVVQYQDMMNVHIPGIALNLIPNIVMKTANINGSIKVINHPYVLVEAVSECPPDYSSRTLLPIQVASIWMIFSALALIGSLPGYVDLVAEELASGFKHQQMVAGLTFWLYWSFNYVFDFITYLVLLSLWSLIVYIFSFNRILFDNHDLTLFLVLVLFLNGLSNLPFVYLLSFVIRGSRFPIIVVALNVIALIASLILYLTLQIYYLETVLTLYYVLSLNPTFATLMSITYLVEVMAENYLCRVCKNDFRETCHGRNTLLEYPSLLNRKTILIFLIYLSSLWMLYMFLVFLLDSNLYRRMFLRFCHRRRDSSRTDEEDGDVSAETERVKATGEAGVDTPLLVDNLVKKFLCGPKAVDKVSFLVDRGECFGLLGVNGAGKTTTFKILTGELLPDSGDARVCNVSVFDRTEYTTKIGYCPQFAACLRLLTGRETLRIIALVRGVPRSEVKREVTNWLELMGIREHADKTTSTYSGGTRRKLSTAMAFMGEPEVVLLDEPTTGVDPVSRRKLWSVIQARQRAGQAVVLTSHSMEECEALCTRLTIMKRGRMKCVGTVEYLKNKFHRGFVVEVKLLDPTAQQMAQFKLDLIQVLPSAQLQDENYNMVQYTVLDTQTSLASVFTEMLRLRRRHDVMQEFTVNNTTLEQLFLSFADR